jgi:flagellar motility protein MotE (MotC chaperone)
MNRKDASEIIESMSPGFAARVTEKLNELYREGSKLIYGG